MTRLLLALGAATLFSFHLPVFARDDGDNDRHRPDRVKFELVETTDPGNPPGDCEPTCCPSNA